MIKALLEDPSVKKQVFAEVARVEDPDALLPEHLHAAVAAQRR